MTTIRLAPRSIPHHFIAGSLLLALAACAGSSRSEPPQQRQLTSAVSPPARLGPPEYLPNMARTVLKTRMVNHARDMGELVSAIMVLDYQSIGLRAGRLADDASWSRPLSGDATELNSLLPEKFFVHQDELRKNARALSTAAASSKAIAVADAYGRLAESCVHCHATYRTGQ